MIAFDDQPYSDFLPTPMTSVRQKKEELGKLSIMLLINEMNGNNKNVNNKSDFKKIIVPTELVVRKSVKNLM